MMMTAASSPIITSVLFLDLLHLFAFDQGHVLHCSNENEDLQYQNDNEDALWVIQSGI